MKYIIWGIGRYYQKYKKYINQDEIQFFVDNNPDNQNIELDGKIVMNPYDADFSQCDYIIIFVKLYSDIQRQLLDMQIPACKIKIWKDIVQLVNWNPIVVSKNTTMSIHQWLIKDSSKKIFVCSHVCSRTGVPVALMHMSIMLKKMGFQVLMGALEGGDLCQDMQEHQIDFTVDLALAPYSMKSLEWMKEFDLIIMGTLMVSDFGEVLSKVRRPVMWWLHESDGYAYIWNKLPENSPYIHYWAGGSRVKKAFKKIYESEKIEELLYYIPESQKKEKAKKYDESIKFALIGTISRRKAQDILINAFDQTAPALREKMQIYFVGKPLFNNDLEIDWDKLQKQFSQIHLLGELSQKQLEQFYYYIDVLICPSRDDPMPIVVSQAMQNYIPCIVSDQVGQSEFMEQNKGGFVFQNENILELARTMEFCVKNPSILQEKGKQARDIFDSYFSESIMEKKLKVILEKYL